MLRKKFTRKKGEIQGHKCIFSFRKNRCFKSILFKIKQKKSKQCEANDFLLSKTKKQKKLRHIKQEFPIVSGQLLWMKACFL